MFIQTSVELKAILIPFTHQVTIVHAVAGRSIIWCIIVTVTTFPRVHCHSHGYQTSSHHSLDDFLQFSHHNHLLLPVTGSSSKPELKQETTSLGTGLWQQLLEEALPSTPVLAVPPSPEVKDSWLESSFIFSQSSSASINPMFPQPLGNAKNSSEKSSSQLSSDKLSELRECFNCAGKVVGGMVCLLGVAVGRSSTLLLVVMM